MEEWRDISGYEGSYQVSNLGRVKSLKRIVTKSNGHQQNVKERILKAGPTNGYLTVFLNRKSEYVHRLVAKTFIENPNNLKEVNHINLNRSYNYPENLEWVSTRDNSLHGHSLKDRAGKYPGISWNGKKKRWSAFAYIDGKSRFFGMFETEEEAHEGYLKALSEHGIESKYSKVA